MIISVATIIIIGLVIIIIVIIIISPGVWNIYLFICINPVDALHPFPSSSDGVVGGDGGWGNPVISLTGIWPNIDPAVDPASPGGRSTAISLISAALWNTIQPRTARWRVINDNSVIHDLQLRTANSTFNWSFVNYLHRICFRKTRCSVP